MILMKLRALEKAARAIPCFLFVYWVKLGRFFFPEMVYCEDYFYVKIPFSISHHMELCLLKVRERQAIIFEYARLDSTWSHASSSYERAKRYCLQTTVG
jgi:hypothetical protein